MIASFVRDAVVAQARENHTPVGGMSSGRRFLGRADSFLGGHGEGMGLL
jgi:hypothetical protein